MKRKISGVHLDEKNDWVAEIDCHHGQHVRHHPPFINPPWVTTPKGQKARLGMLLKSLKCDRNNPEDSW